MSSEVVYAPPPGPPPSHDPSYAPPSGPPPNHWHHPTLVPAAFPLLSVAQVHSLSSQGFTTFPISSRPALLDAANNLFSASRAFFAQPQSTKSQYQVRTGNAQGSEEGWSRVVGEKELLTVRRGGDVCPPAVESEARALWRECGSLMQEVTRGVEQSLDMLRGALDGVVNAECVMPEGGADRVETLLRMFRYERRSDDPRDEVHAGKGRLVAEPHRDLGILSLVIGASPGLEVWDVRAGAWIPIEEPLHTGSSSGITVTLLVGETLTRLTNARYASGRHRVFVPPPSPSDTDPEAHFRYSLVFALRPHAEARVSTAALTTPITGIFLNPLVDVRAQQLFAAIARTHWNVNTGLKEREAQRMRLQGGKGYGPDEEQKKDTYNIYPEPKEKKRWSISGLRSSGLPQESDDSPPRRNRWSVFQRISRK